MILRSVQIKNFRGVKQASFTDLSDHLNLFYGPNESGKSTLVEALHFGLFEKSAGKASHKTALQTWGGSEAPEVEVSFEDDDGELWHVEKRFLLQPHTVLSSSHRTFRGKEAEAKLREMFRTQPGNRNGVVDDDLGIWPLLWVRQGRSGTPTKDVINDDARDALSQTLAARTGTAVAGSIGATVREQVTLQYRQYFTPTGQKNKAYKDVLDAEEAARLTLADVTDRYHDAQATADELRRTREEVTKIGNRIARQRDVIADAVANAEAAEAAKRKLEVHRKDVELARRDASEAEAALKRREGLQAELAAARQALDAAVDAHDAAKATHTKRDALRQTLKAEAQQAQEAARRASRTLDRVQRAARRAQLDAEHDALATTIAKAEAAQQAGRELQDRIDAMVITPPALEDLEHLCQQASRARDRVDAASAQVTITARKATTVDGDALDAGAIATRRIHATTSLTIGDVVDIEVRPGEGEIDALRVTLTQADAARDARLEALGVASLTEARKAHDARRHLLRERDSHHTRFEVLAPDGLSPLREALAKLDVQRAAAGEAHDDLPPLAEAQRLRDEADAARDAAQADAETHEALWEASRTLFEEARTEMRRLDEHVLTLKGQVGALDGAASLTKKHEEARAILAEALLKQEALTKRFDEAGGTQATQALSMEQQALTQLEARLRASKEREVELRVRIHERSEAGLADALQDARAAFEAAHQDALRTTERAEARRLLYEAVEDAYRRMRDRFAAPVRQAVEANVGILFPGSRLELDDDGDAIGLRTGDVVETFEQLSGGAREQFGVLVRLGIAQVLSEGRRLPVILDDALVNSDAERRARMVEVLRRMAATLQILVFTCHDEDFDRLAAPKQFRVKGRPGRSQLA